MVRMRYREQHRPLRGQLSSAHQIQGEMALKCCSEKDPPQPDAAGSTFTPSLG